MALTVDVKEAIIARARSDSEFADGILEQSAECLLNGEVNVGKLILRDYIDAILGIEQLSRLTGMPPDDIEHMLEPDGSPETDDLLETINCIRQHKDTHIQHKDTHIKAEAVG